MTLQERFLKIVGISFVRRSSIHGLRRGESSAVGTAATGTTACTATTATAASTSATTEPTTTTASASAGNAGIAGNSNSTDRKQRLKVTSIYPLLIDAYNQEG